MWARLHAVLVLVSTVGTCSSAVIHGESVYSSAVPTHGDLFSIDIASTLLTGLSSTATLSLEPVVGYRSWPKTVNVLVTGTIGDSTTDSDAVVIAPSTVYDVYTANSTGDEGFTIPEISLVGLRLNESGAWNLNFTISCNADEGVPLPAFCTNSAYAKTVSTSTYVIPGVLSLLPPLLTLICAIVTRLTLVSLLLGIWAGALCLSSYNPITGFLRTFDTYFLNSFCNSGHSGIVLFTLLLGGLLGVVQKGGGFTGLANLAQSLTKGSRTRGLVIGFVLGLVIFFDDYSAILIVGSALKPILKKVKVAPEKAAFIVHSMGVCLAGLAPISSWLGAEIGYIQVQVTEAGMDSGPNQLQPFQVFIGSIAYRLFPVLLLVYILALIILDRDWGPLFSLETKFISQINKEEATADRQSSTQSDASNPLSLEEGGTDSFPSLDQANSEPVEEDSTSEDKAEEEQAPPSNPALEPDESVPKRALNAIIPFVVVIVITFVGMYLNGADTLKAEGRNVTFSDAISNSSSITALIWSASAGIVVAMVMLGIQRIASVQTLLEAWNAGATEVLEPTLILLLAWGLGDVIADIHTAAYIASALESGGSGGGFPVSMVQPIALLLSMVVAFATGSAMGTMGILFPLCIPLAVSLSADATEAQTMVTCVSGAIFSGCAFGNCCSPIADCSVLAALATGCDMADHVRSAIPHCALVGGISLALAFVPLSVLPLWGRWVIAVGVLACAIAFLTRRPLNGADQPLWWRARCSKATPDSQTPLLDPLASVESSKE